MIDYIVDHLLEIIAIAAAFVIFFLQLRRKALSYTILTNSSVVSVSDKVQDNIQILYKGNVVPSVRLVEIRIKNSGSLPIKPDDYVQPLSVRCRNLRVLSFEVIDTHSVGAYVETELSSLTEIVLSKSLLNPKDFYDIKILTTGDTPDLSLVGRIVGVSKIQKRTSPAGKIQLDYRPLLVGMGIAFMISIGRLLENIYIPANLELPLALILAVLIVYIFQLFAARSEKQD